MEISQALSTFKPTASPELIGNPAPQTVVETIFDRLAAQFGNKIADLWSTGSLSEVKLEWADALRGYSRREVERGLRACQTRVFAPTLGEFLRLCRPALDPELAWLEARAGIADRANGLKGEWTHSAVYRASQQMPFELSTKSFKECRKAWEWTLEREFARGFSEIPEPPTRIEHQPKAGGPPNPEIRAVIAKQLAGRAA